MSTDITLSPNRIPWPPLIYAGAAGVAVTLGYLCPYVPQFMSDHRGIVLEAGITIMVTGAAFDLSAMLTMWRHRANILPHRAATALLTSGPFSWSRNPIYLGNTLMLAGAAPTFGNPWFLLLALIAAVLVTALAIQREEQHLAALFGSQWLTYAGRTPRWFAFWRTRSWPPSKSFLTGEGASRRLQRLFARMNIKRPNEISKIKAKPPKAR